MLEGWLRKVPSGMRCLDVTESDYFWSLAGGDLDPRNKCQMGGLL